MVKRPDNAIAEVDVKMLDGRYAFNQHILVKDLRSFFKRHKNEIDWICFDIDLTGYFWSKEVGWQQWGKFRYNGGRKKPDITYRPHKIAELGGSYINLELYNQNRANPVTNMW